MAGVSRHDTIAVRLQKFRRKAQPLSAIPNHTGPLVLPNLPLDSISVISIHNDIQYIFQQP